MTNIRVFIYSDNEESLKDFAICGIKYASKKRIKNNTLEVIWVCETNDVCDAIATCDENINEYEMNLYNLKRGPLMPYYPKK